MPGLSEYGPHSTKPQYVEFIENRGSEIRPLGGVASAGVSKLAAAADHVHPGLRLVSPPESLSDAGEPGMISFDDECLYICVDTDTWKCVYLSDELADAGEDEDDHSDK